MRSKSRLVAAVCLVLVVAVMAGCGTKSSGSGSGSASSASSSSACANAGGHHKFKVAIKVGATYGSFKHWVYNPLKAGAFKKDAPGRTKALIKAGATLVADAALLKSVSGDVRDDKQLCHIFSPFTRAAAILGTVGAKLKSGQGSEKDVSDATGLFNQVKSDL